MRCDCEAGLCGQLPKCSCIFAELSLGSPAPVDRQSGAESIIDLLTKASSKIQICCYSDGHLPRRHRRNAPGRTGSTGAWQDLPSWAVAPTPLPPLILGSQSRSGNSRPYTIWPVSQNNRGKAINRVLKVSGCVQFPRPQAVIQHLFICRLGWWEADSGLLSWGSPPS